MHSSSFDTGLGQQLARATLARHAVPGCRAVVASLTLHLGFACLVLRPPAWRMPSTNSWTDSSLRSAGMLVAPPAAAKSDRRESIRQRGGRTSRPASSKALAAMPFLNGIQIAILPDHGRQLLPVLRRFGGCIALAKADSPRRLVDTFRVGDFQSLGPTDLDDWLAFRLWDPEAWPELGPLVRRCSEDCIFYALFKPHYRWVLLRAASDRARCPQLHTVVLRFHAASAPGVEVVSVECTSVEAKRNVFGAPNVYRDEGVPK